MYYLAHPVSGRHRLGYAEIYIRSTFFSQLENLDSAYDLPFLSIQLDHMQNNFFLIRQQCRRNWAHQQYMQGTSDEYQYHTNRSCYL